MRSFKFNIGDLLKVINRNGPDCILARNGSGKEYRDSLRVEFRFWDGNENVYIVATGDGTCLPIGEDDVELQESAGEALAEMPREVQEPDAAAETYTLTREQMLDFAEKMTFLLDSRLVPFSRETLRSEAWLMGFTYALEQKR